MKQRYLTKRHYLGTGYVHVFVDTSTQTELVVPCTQEEYELMGQKNGAIHNPVRKGYIWIESLGGTYKVDTANTMLGDDEYCEVGGQYIVNLANEVGEKKHQKVELGSIDAQGLLDEDKLQIKIT